MLKSIRHIFMTCLFIALFSLSCLAEEKVIPESRWYQGSFQGQPALNVHENWSVTNPNDLYRYAFEMQLKIIRQLGQQKSTLSLHQIREYDVHNNNSFSFHFQNHFGNEIEMVRGQYQRENNNASLKIEESSKEYKTVNFPQSKLLKITLPGSLPELLCNQKKIGESFNVSTLELSQGQLVLVQSTYTLIELHDKKKVFQLEDSLMPGAKSLLHCDLHGHTLEMVLQLGPLSLRYHYADKAQDLQAAEFNVDQIIPHKGPLPRHAEFGETRNVRYRINFVPEITKAIIDDPFQEADATSIIVRSDSPATQLNEEILEGYLKDEAGLSLTDPAFSRWHNSFRFSLRAPKANSTGSYRKRAIAWRDWTRKHIIQKDMSANDLSAAETFKEQRGDCTEHTNLLCAALRLDGIYATRHFGAVFSPQKKSWVGHAWVQAYNPYTKTWFLLDAAFPGIPRSHYLSLGSISGDTAEALSQGMSQLISAGIEVLPVE